MAEHNAVAATTTAAEAQNTARPVAKRQRRTAEQKIAYLRSQLAQVTAQQHKRSRQLDTREKIVIGGAIIKAMRDSEAFRAQLLPILEANVIRDIDREAIASWLSPISTSR